MEELVSAVRTLALDGEADQIHRLVRNGVANGADRQDLIAALTSLMLELRAEGQEAAEDQVLDVLDCLEGWCSPQARI
jgi:hypothetical protein